MDSEYTGGLCGASIVILILLYPAVVSPFKKIDGRVLTAAYTLYGQERTIHVYQDPDEIRFDVNNRIFEKNGIVLIESYGGQSPRVPWYQARKPGLAEQHLWESYFGLSKTHFPKVSGPSPLSWPQPLTSLKKNLGQS